MMIAGRERRKEVNAADVEHLGALVSGGLLLLTGMTKKGFMGFLLKASGAALIYRGQQGYRPLYDAIGLSLPDITTGVGRRNVRVESEVIIHRPRQELYRIWRNLQNLPVFMDHLISVHEIDDGRSLWVAKAPAGMVVKWDAVIVNDIENEVIAWSTMEGSGVDHAGSVRFKAIGAEVTKVTLVMRYDPPGDMFGVFVGKLFGQDPQKQIDRDLERFRLIMELGSQPSPKSAWQADVERIG